MFDHTDPEQASGWTLTTTQANGCLRTFNVVSKSSLVNQNLLWGNFWERVELIFCHIFTQKLVKSFIQKCPQSRFWLIRELFHTTLKVLRQPLALMVVKVQPETVSGSVWSVTNLKALNRAKGPVQRFRALRATIACIPPLKFRRRARVLPVRRRARTLWCILSVTCLQNKQKK